MKTSKGFSPVIAIVIVLVVGLAASAAIYFTTRETGINTNKNTNQVATNENVNQNANLNSNTNAVADETAGWKTYTNEKYGYLLKFPSNWVWASAYDGLEKEITDSSLINSNYNLFIVKGSEGFVIQACSMASVIECSPNSVSKWRQNKDIGKEETITLGNAKFTKIKLKDDPSNWYITENGNYFYEIRVMDTSSTVINEILSTFQFTDETASWKTYENSKYNYVVKYPENIFNIAKSNLDEIQFAYEGQDFHDSSRPGYGKMSVLIKVTDSGVISLDKYVEGAKDHKTVNEEKDITFVGHSAKKLTTTWKLIEGSNPPKGTKQISVIFLKDSKIYDLSYQQLPGQKDYSSQYNLILSTFQFTK